MDSSDSHDAQVQLPGQVVVQAYNEKPGVFAAGTIVGASYEVIELLGRGAMGMVYRVRHVTLSTEYALKILTDDKQDEVSVIRFQNEAQAIAKLNHPNIVAIYNFGVHEGSLPFYVMDLLAGEDLLDKIVCDGPMTPEAALPLFVEACAGLSFAHRKGILHRDVKPANLLILEKTDVHGANLKVVDFGIVKFAEELKPEVQKLTAMGIVCGSPSYMSPEQAMGQKVDPRSDIYSLGCSLFEALTGKVPFRGRSASDTMMMHATISAPTLAEKNPERAYSADLENVVAKMMAKEPMYRYQSMDAVAQDLKNILEGKPLAASPMAVRPMTNRPYAQSNFGVAQGKGGGAAEGAVTLSLGRDNRVSATSDNRDAALFDTQLYSSEQAASGEYENDEYENDDEDSREFGSSGRVRIAITSVLVLGMIGIATFFVVQQQKLSSSSPTRVDKRVGSSPVTSELKLVSNVLNEELYLDAVVPEPEADAASVELTKDRYFSKTIDVNGQEFTHFAFPSKSKVRPFAYIGTSMKDKACAFGDLKFPRNSPIYLVPSPNVLLKKEFIGKFRHGEIREVILWPPFASDMLAIESAKIPGIRGYSMRGCSELTPAIIPALMSLTCLESFDASSSSIESRDLAKLRFLPGLKQLVLSHCVAITPILEELKGSRNLESLDVSDTGIGANDFRLIASLTSLKGLVLDGNKISSADMQQLSRLTHLKELSLVKVHLKDGSVARVLERLPSLRMLFVDKGHFRKQDLDYLKQHAPHLSVRYFAERQNFFGQE